MQTTLFISYALPHCTTEMVKDIFDELFDNQVTKIAENTRKDRTTGRDFKLFWITLDSSKPGRLGNFIRDMGEDGKRIAYDETHGKVRYWIVRLNKVKTVEKKKFVPRILELEEGEIKEDFDFKGQIVKIDATEDSAERQRLAKEYVMAIPEPVGSRTSR